MSTPTSHSITPTSTVASADANQFVVAHNFTTVYQSKDVRRSIGDTYGTNEFFGGMIGWREAVGGQTIALKFQPTQDISNSLVVRLPITINGTAIAPTGAVAASYDNAVDFTVTIVPDGGSPPYNNPSASFVNGSTLVPAELITAAAQNNWPEPQEDLLTNWTNDTQAQLPPTNPYSGGYFIAYGTAGLYAIAGCLANAAGAITPNTYVAAYDSGTLQPWVTGSSVPTTTSGAAYSFPMFVYSPNNDVIIIFSLYTVSGATITTITPTNLCYIASFAQDGTMGAWQQQPTLPVTLAECPSVLVTLPSTAGNQDWLLIFDTYNVGSSSTGTTVYAAAISAGQVGGWLTLTAPPFPTTGAPIVLSDAMTVMMVDLSGGQVLTQTLTTDIDGNPVFGSWTRMSNSALQSYTSLIGIVNGTILADDGGTDDITVATAVDLPLSNLNSNLLFQSGASGLALGSSFGGAAASWQFTNNNGTTTILTYGGVFTSLYGAVLQTCACQVEWVNVPVAITTTLTAGSAYHVVLTFNAGTNASNVNIATTSLNTNYPYQYAQVYNGSSWVSQSFDVPFQVWAGETQPNGASAPVLAFIDDNGTRVSYLWYGAQTAQLLDAAQWTTNDRAAQILYYDATTGQLESITEVA